MAKTADLERDERKSLAGSTTTMTLHSRAMAELQLEQGQSGRFTDKVSVSGAEASVRYPRQPADSPFAADLSGIVAELGIPPGEEIKWNPPRGSFLRGATGNSSGPCGDGCSKPPSTARSARSP